MKHEITTYRTKKLLSDALKQAMRRETFSKITVSEIIRISGVNRKTFYYHFEDIFALLKWTLEEETLTVIRHFDLLADYEEAIRFVMNYVEENDYIISCAYDSIGRDEMKRFFYADFLGVVTSVIDAAEQKLGATIEPDFKSAFGNAHRLGKGQGETRPREGDRLSHVDHPTGAGQHGAASAKLTEKAECR